ncbi:hypothetical protein [Massilia glaciei]|uniref:hypothetical protein n=1 Tax=Massilia glaciei TaxID=1524097 RepID=UPI0011B23CA4|nr:hypothetical protein [Massilia glaciei]
MTENPSSGFGFRLPPNITICSDLCLLGLSVPAHALSLHRAEEDRFFASCSGDGGSIAKRTFGGLGGAIVASRCAQSNTAQFLFNPLAVSRTVLVGNS